MTYKEFLREMDDILGLPAGTIRGDEKLEELENWDSTALVSFLVLAESAGGASPSLGQVANCATVADLVHLSRIEIGELR
jgi:acyl carrier protein